MKKWKIQCRKTHCTDSFGQDLVFGGELFAEVRKDLAQRNEKQYL